MANFIIYAASGKIRRSFTGRTAQILDLLIEAGSAGLAAADLPAGVRLAAYIHRLRAADVPIRARSEPNGGTFGGFHARYSLAAVVERAEAGR